MYNKEKQAIDLQVTDGLTVAVLKHSDHEFLMDTNSVAKGYGIAKSTVRWHLSQNDEIIEEKHFIRGVGKTNTHANTHANAQPHQVFWTKAGIIRLGFFIKSERAKLFRDWAEQVLLEEIHAPEPLKHLPRGGKRNHNRLTQARLVSILADVARIEDSEIRLSLIKKLGV